MKFIPPLVNDVTEKQQNDVNMREQVSSSSFKDQNRKSVSDQNDA